MAENQTAIFATAIGQPLSTGSRPIPEPREGQVLIKVTVAGLNPHDAKARDYGLFIKDYLPAVLAADVVGVVTRVGPNVTRFQPGDHIFGQAWVPTPGSDAPASETALAMNNSSGLQEYAVLDARYSAKVPSAFTDAQLATLPTNLVTSAVALFDTTALGIPAPWTPAASTFDYAATALLILGGGTNTGRFGIQLAALAGIGKIVVVASPRSEAEARALGATHIVDRTGKSGQEIAAAVREIVGDELLYAYDTINPPDSQYIGVEALSNSQRGKLARLRPSEPVDESKLSTEKSAGYEVMNVFGSSSARPAVAEPLWERVEGLLAEGTVKPTGYQVIRGLDVEAVNKTLDAYSSGDATGHWQVHL
ncbi:zinc-binding alcohol dehydrogenase family protein [Aspergillus saccharolyticus JOP 1030-1]|uniref:GroES-like protein n=1 Tax=Aspergillus saccharolyticus JOP 1030-1 TaxID=1450539 RepID=A0A318ZSX9_9EURO|nr:GroES-like protein [Aspergillus saccharolyticus JOP 1030-1]PYH49805.1 GroES-like protein [Aspergillus saccharolyticus JOP 1030-1]